MLPDSTSANAVVGCGTAPSEETVVDQTDYDFAPLCRTASNSVMIVAIATFSESA